jgi:scyllo-inositol 2-dehydrogenase (NADP+)
MKKTTQAMGVPGRIVRVGIAGQGRSGFGIHAAWLRQAGARYRIVAVADALAERRREAEAQFGAASFTDYRDMLAAGGFELFVNALPSPLHVPATLAALARGCHVICEKPMAPTVREFDRMAAAARKAGRLLAPFQNNRHQPFFVKMLEIVRSGVLGDLVAVRSVWGGFGRRWDWQTLQCNMGGSLFNTGPHAVDQALQFFGEKETPDVFCRMQCRNELGGDADDFCALTLNGRNAPHVEVLLTSYLAYPQGPMYSVSGTRGGLTGGAESLQWKYYDPRKAGRPAFWRTWSEGRQYPHEQLPWIEKTWRVSASVAKGAKSGYTLTSFQVAVKQFYDNVYDVLRGAGQLAVTLPQVRRQIAVIEECHRQNPLPRKWRRWVPGKGGVK